MKANTTAIGIIDWVGKKVVKIDEHRGKHYQASTSPVFSPKKPGKKKWQKQVT